MKQLLNQLGLVTSPDRIYDFVKNYLYRHNDPALKELKESLTAFLDLNFYQDKTDQMLHYLIEHKFIALEEDKVYATKLLINFVNKEREAKLQKIMYARHKTQPIILKESGLIMEQGGKKYKLYDDGRIGMFP